jgi:hypothetical protein
LKPIFLKLPNLPSFLARAFPGMKHTVIFWTLDVSYNQYLLDQAPEALKEISYGAIKPENPIKTLNLAGFYALTRPAME